MTGKRKTKNVPVKVGEEECVIPMEIAKPELIDSRLDTLGESVAELFSRVTKLEEMLEVLISSAPVEPKVEKTEVTDVHDYVVQKGEIAMSVIAKKLYGNAGLFNRIAAHNYDRYPELRANANEVKEGWVLRIPPAP